jgi:hypothetical protein
MKVVIPGPDLQGTIVHHGIEWPGILLLVFAGLVVLSIVAVALKFVFTR